MLPLPAPVPPQLRYDFTQCTDGDELLTRFMGYLQTEREIGRVILGPVGLPAALTKLSRLPTPAGGWDSDPRFQAMLAEAEALLISMRPYSFVGTFYALARLQTRLPQRFLTRFWAHSGRGLARCKPQEQSNLLYAAGELLLVPPPDWMASFWTASGSALPTFKSQELSNMLYGCQQMGVRPPVAWLQRYLVVSASLLPEYSTQEMSNTIFSLGLLDIAPPDAYLARFWAATAAALPRFKPQELSNTLYACGRLDIAPPAAWMQRYWLATSIALAAYNEQDFSNTLYACGRLQQQPPEEWAERFWALSAPRLLNFTPQELSNTLFAHALLQLDPPEAWLARLWPAAAASTPGFNEQNCANMIYAAAMLDVMPPPAFLQPFWPVAVARMHRSQELTNTFFACCVLRLWATPVVPMLWQRLLHNVVEARLTGAPAARGDELHTKQIYQLYRNAELDVPGALAPPPPDLFAVAKASWLEQAQNTGQVGSFHREVSSLLSAEGIAHENERWCDRSERRIDIAVEAGPLRLAIEVDGPSHFLHTGRQNGPTRLRNRLLEHHGWTVRSVDVFSWRRLGRQQREAFMEQLLQSAEQEREGARIPRRPRAPA